MPISLQTSYGLIRGLFSTFAVIKDKRARILSLPNTLQKRMFAHYRKCQRRGIAMQNDILNHGKKSEHLRPGAHIPSHAQTRKLNRKSDGGHKRDERQSIRDLQKVRGK